MSHRFALAGLCSLALGACAVPAVYFTPRVSQIGIDGEFGIQERPDLDARASADTFGMDGDSSVLSGRVDLLAVGHGTSSARHSAHDGEGTAADAELSNRSVTISVGDPVRSEINFSAYSEAWTFDLIPGDAIEFGLGLGVTALDVAASFLDQLTSASVRNDELVPIPDLIGRMGANFGAVEVSRRVSWIDLAHEDTPASSIDIDAMARLRISGDSKRFSGYVAAGYRFLDVEAEFEDGSNSVGIDAEFNGPWVGLSVSF